MVTATGEAPVQTQTHARRHRGMFVGVVILVLLPLVVALISLLGTHWHAASDDALELLRIRDVLGRHTPLTGVQSRFGWNHPGPLLFWVLAPFERAFGETGVLFGVGLLNCVALFAALFVAWRRGGIAFVVILSIALLLLLRALGSTVLIDPWNPWVAALPFLAYVLLAWSVAERDWVALPLAVAVGSFLVQTHVGYAPIVIGVGGAAGVLSCVGPRDPGRESWWSLRRAAIASAMVAVALWLAPIIQQFTGNPGNLGEIIRYFRHPTEPAAGLSVGWGIMGNELGGAWLRGNDAPSGVVATGSVVIALALLVATTVLGVVAWRHGRGAVARFAFLMVAAAGVGVIAGARITGLRGTYLVRWWWVLGALLCASLAWCVYSLFARTRWSTILATVGVGVAAMLSVVVAWNAVPTTVPFPNDSHALAYLTPLVTQHLDKRQPYLVTFVDSRDLGAIGSGLYLDLARHGYDVKVTDTLARAFGRWRVAGPDEVAGTITVVGSDDIAKGWTPPAGAQLIGHYTPRRSRDSAYTVYLGPRSN
jgi:hypothetical protein